jgi:Zn-dependent peptidase ImmA (M78 family)
MMLNVPEIDDGQIEQLSSRLLEDYWAENPNLTRSIQSPIESIAEHYLGYELIVTDEGLFESSELLGGIVFEEQVILVNASIEHHDGRFAFTVAHEIGHHVLHRDLYFAQLKGGDSEIICRDTEDKPLIEVQADRFASSLLLPESLVRQAFKQLDRPRPRTARQAMGVARQLLKCMNVSNVSISAAVNRLINLRLINSRIPLQSSQGIRSYGPSPWYRRLAYSLYKKLLK